MSTEKTWQTRSQSSEDTEALGERIGARLKGGEVIELVSDLGGGKTTFTRGLVRGAGSPDRVASPTFTVVRQYDAPKLNIFHFDFYRLDDPGIIVDELREYLSDPWTVVIVEWSDVVREVLPKDRTTITISAVGETERIIDCTFSPKFSYLFPR
ncbi:MAG: tRNA (adenosine(37)-N6)-threonylcarbamoyltransferase complex ATPase subunit type 1 TsaE [Candidatus Saccharimonadales bacterium]|nr:tRNA (adenosine(37)-N6)-threonylcarbamoyltransferase complex ATPase subunit type 1 TsaE [Candidatus Saccharibacteria bacterium]